MKSNTKNTTILSNPNFIFFIIILLVFSVCINIYLGQEFRALNQQLAEPASYDENTSHQLHFIWNDDEEAFPMDNELIKVEFTKNDTIYLAPSDIE